VKKRLEAGQEKGGKRGRAPKHRGPWKNIFPLFYLQGRVLDEATNPPLPNRRRKGAKEDTATARYDRIRRERKKTTRMLTTTGHSFCNCEGKGEEWGPVERRTSELGKRRKGTKPED